MICIMEKGIIIGMKQSGKSNRKIAKETGHDRSVISRIWSEYCKFASELNKHGADVKTIQERMTEETKMQTRKGVRRKFTEEVNERLREILEEEKKKDRRLGNGHKQKLTNKQIHEKPEAEGIDISRATINAELARLRRTQKEVFIRQTYDLGDRPEYDFGEVRLDCGEGVKTYHMAVLSSPGGKFRCKHEVRTLNSKGIFRRKMHRLQRRCTCTQIRKKEYLWTAKFAFLK